MKTTIQDLESRLEDGLSKLRSPEYDSLGTFLQPLVSKDYRAHVSLFDKSGRKKKKNASANNWSPDSGEIRIFFEPVAQSSSSDRVKPDRVKPDRVKPDSDRVKPESTPATAKSTERKPAMTSDPVSDLVRVLDRTESRPGYEFIALKWFRDVVLPAEGFEWALSDQMRQSVLRETIERRLVLTSRVPNPKSPQFPVTAIRLNRLLPDTQAILGAAGISDSEFDPIEIRGENLSATILRERR